MRLPKSHTISRNQAAAELPLSPAISSERARRRAHAVQLNTRRTDRTLTSVAGAIARPRLATALGLLVPSALGLALGAGKVHAPTISPWSPRAISRSPHELS